MFPRDPQSWIILPILLVVAAVAGGAELAVGPGPEQGVLLLRDGQVLEGKISRTGEVYHVALPNGAIRVKASEVAFQCRSIQEGYLRRRAAGQIGNVHHHLELARWCLRHELYGDAARELADAMDAEPRHPLIGVLERRLRVALQQPTARPQPAKTTDASPSPEDLQRLIRGMPAGTVEKFTQVIQPVLVNNCTASGCHGPGAGAEFRLSRLPVGRPPSRLITLRNLHATLRWLDRKHPGSSPLLRAPIRPHGTAKTAVFSDPQSNQYRRLVDWVLHVAERPKPNRTDTPASPKGGAVAAVAEIPPASPTLPSEVSTAVHRQVFPDPQGQRLLLGSGSSVKRGAPLSGFVPKDPFDPAIFNRRYFPR